MIQQSTKPYSTHTSTTPVRLYRGSETAATDTVAVVIVKSVQVGLFVAGPAGPSISGKDTYQVRRSCFWSEIRNNR